MYTHIPKVDAKYLRQLNEKLPKVTPYTIKPTASFYYHFRFG